MIRSADDMSSVLVLALVFAVSLFVAFEIERRNPKSVPQFAALWIGIDCFITSATGFVYPRIYAFVGIGHHPQATSMSLFVFACALFSTGIYFVARARSRRPPQNPNKSPDTTRGE